MRNDTVGCGVEGASYTFGHVLAEMDSAGLGRTEQCRIGKTLPDSGIRGEGRAYRLADDSFITGGLFLVFLVLAVVLSRSKDILLHCVKGFFSSKREYASDTMNASGGEVRNAILFSCATCLSLSLLAYGGFADRGTLNTVFSVPYWLLGTLFVAVSAFILVKALLYSFVNWVFFSSESGRKWFSSYFLLVSLFSFLLLPVAVMSVSFNISSEKVAFCLLIILILYEMLMLYKLCANFKSKKYGLLLIFLYFCAIEIMPLLVVWRMLDFVNDSFMVKI